MSRLTESARGKCCIRCGAPDAYACHYNGTRQHAYGKGRGIKCNDLMTAEFCQVCDFVFSEGSTEDSVFRQLSETVHWGDRWSRSEDFMHWINMTNIRRLSDGALVVK